ncbi:MAG: Gldg family protein [Alphaproteobacteria bacterium]
MTGRKRIGWIGVFGLAILAFIGINIGIHHIGNARLDLTEERLFTLSDGTKSVLKSLGEPVRLEFYFSSALGKEIPGYAVFATRVRDMLDEFKAVAGDKLIIDTFDPQPFSETEDQAVEAGMQGVPLDQTGDEVYFGIVGFASEDRENGSAIPFFQSDRGNFLEYDLTKLIYRVANPELPVVGVISDKPVFGDPMAQMRGGSSDPWAIVDQMEDFFDVRYVYDAETLLEDSPDILLIIHPKAFDPDFAYAIDQHLLRGGRAIVFYDPWNETNANAPASGPGGPAVESSFEPFFDRWGVRISGDAVVGDRGSAQMVNAGDGTNFIPVPYVIWMKPTAAQLNKDDAILSSIGTMLIPSAGSIEVNEDSPLSVQPLIQSSADATLIPVDRLATPDPTGLLEDYAPTGETYVMAARLSGTVTTAFPDGPPPPEPEEAAEDADTTAGQDTAEEEAAEQEPEERPAFLPHLAASEAPMNVVLVADADMLEDRFWVRVQNFFGQRVAVPQADNGAFLVNALDNLHGSNDLLSLRSRGTGSRPFVAIDALRRQAETDYRAEERALQKKMQETEEKLANLQAGADADAVEQDTAATDAEIEKFTHELIDTRRKLREVNLSLRQDIEALQSRVRIINIGLMPVLVCVFAIGLGYYRSRRRQSARDKALS